MRKVDFWTMAWLFGAIAFAIHIGEEIVNGSYGVYADIEVFLSTIIPGLKLPPYRYDVWLINLIGAAAILFALTWLVYVKRGPMRIASYVFATFLTLNGIGHLYAALSMNTYFPGAVTAALLVTAGLVLFAAIPKENARNAPTH